MAKRNDLESYLNTLLAVDRFKDYGPNGLQVEGRAEVRRIVSGVTGAVRSLRTRLGGGRGPRTARPDIWALRHVSIEVRAGDVVGIIDRGTLRIGDTLSESRNVQFQDIPRFPPEHFARVLPAGCAAARTSPRWPPSASAPPSPGVWRMPAPRPRPW